MLQVELVRSWLDGAEAGSVGSVSVVGDLLVHYKTAIAQRMQDGRIILNYTRYSLATGRVQKMVADAVDRDRIVFVSGVAAGFRGPLDTLVGGAGDLEDYVMRVRHAKFGEGFVTSIDGNMMSCLFSGRKRTLMYPDVIESGLVEVIEDRRT